MCYSISLDIQRFIFEYSRIRLSQQNLNYTAYVLTPVASKVIYLHISNVATVI